MQLTDKARAFLAKHPTLIGRVAGHAFYEHPTLGDEAPLIMITPKGEVKRSDWYDMPTIHDLYPNATLTR
jgi:hypothetical protein